MLLGNYGPALLASLDRHAPPLARSLKPQSPGPVLPFMPARRHRVVDRLPTDNEALNRSKDLPCGQSFDYSRMMEESHAALVLAALGHEARLSAFRRLIGAGPEGIAAGSLSSALNMPPSTLSHHLASLEHAGIVRARRDGRHVIYAVVPDAVRALIGFLRDDCCGGQPSLCGLGEREATRP